MTTGDRVVVGISQSLAGLAAIRYAVGEARRRSATLHAVRVWRLPTPTRSASYLQWQDRQLVAAAHLFVDEAFAAALGGFSDDLDVVVSTPAGQPTSILKEAAQLEAGLLVLGAPASRWRHSRVVRGCTRAAACPVVVVPAPELARQWRRLPIRRMVAAIARDHGR